MAAKRCTEHPHTTPYDLTPNGRCRACVNRAGRKYQTKQRENARKYRQIQELLAV